jgi:hypothetical protein
MDTQLFLMYAHRITRWKYDKKNAKRKYRTSKLAAPECICSWFGKIVFLLSKIS